MEDDDHLSAGFTENGARKGGLNFYRLAFFQKGKVLQSFVLPLGHERQGIADRHRAGAWQALLSSRGTSRPILGIW